jgi:Cysteine-rich secretory protein family
VASDGRGVSSRGSPQTRLSRPLLVLLLAAPLMLAVLGSGHRGVATAAVGDCTPEASWGTVRGDLAAQVVGLVNQHRAGIGRDALVESATLTAAAVWKARHMAAYGYMSHDDPAPPVQRQWFERFAACGYTAGSSAENIAYGYPSPTSVMQGWLSSPGHKANIEGSFRAIGVGVAAASNGTLYWAQTFGSVADSGAPPPSPPPPPVAPPSLPAPPPAPPPATAKAPPPTPRPATAAPAPPAPASPQSGPEAPAQRAPYAADALEASRLLEWGPRPRAGRTFTGRLRIIEPDTRRRVETGRVTCNAHSAGRRVWVGIHRFRNGFVVCRWQVPNIARRHRLIGTIRVFAEGKRTARWFSRIVR